MMVSYYGGRCLLVEERERGEEPRAALFSPHTKTSKARTLEKKSQIILTDEPIAKKTEAVEIAVPGEYDVSGFMIRGVAADDALCFVLTGKQLSFGYLTHGPNRELNDQELERIGTIDILAVPVPFRGQKDPIEGLGAFVRALEPKVVIPMSEKPKMRKAAASELGTELKEEKKINVSVRDLPEEGFHLVGLAVQ